jgi:hypothetical protein
MLLLPLTLLDDGIGGGCVVGGGGIPTGGIGAVVDIGGGGF